MPRHLRSLILLAPALGALGFLVACGSSGPEQQILTTFFRASRVRDNATLGNVAAVSLDPRTEGSVQDFTIVTVAPEERRPMTIVQLTADEAAAKKAETEFAKKKNDYQVANLDAIKRVVKAEADKQTIKGKDAEVQAAWAKWLDDQRDNRKTLASAKEKLAREKALAVNSLTVPGGRSDADISGMELELVSKQVTVSATVRDPNGQEAPKTLVFTMQRAAGKKDGQTHDGHWIITGMKGAAVPAS